MMARCVINSEGKAHSGMKGETFKENNMKKAPVVVSVTPGEEAWGLQRPAEDDEWVVNDSFFSNFCWLFDVDLESKRQDG